MGRERYVPCLVLFTELKNTDSVSSKCHRLSWRPFPCVHKLSEDCTSSVDPAGRIMVGSAGSCIMAGYQMRGSDNSLPRPLASPMYMYIWGCCSQRPLSTYHLFSSTGIKYYMSEQKSLRWRVNNRGETQNELELLTVK